MSGDPLLQPYRLKHLTLRNRIMTTAHEPAYPEDGMPKERYAAYHAERAKAGVALAKELEAFNTAFFATFGGSFTPRDQLSQLLNGGTASTTVRKPHRVNYYRTREEYLKVCQPKMPVNIGITLGLYIPGDRMSYFFHPEDPEADVRRTVFHEEAPPAME